MSDATSRRLKVSREGIVLIKSFEGFRPRAVRDEDGRWVIGYGHTASARESASVSEADAELLLQYDLLPVVKALNEQVSTPLNQHQFDALASFAISVGVERFLASDVLQRLNTGHVGEAADALFGWPEATPPDAGLRRRAAERALFVADPATPVHLVELLTSPLPAPAAEETAPAPAADSASDARAAAVAALLGETPVAAAPPTSGSEPEPDPTFQQTPTPAPSIQLQRYAPYAAPMIGPLPGLPQASDAPQPGTADDDVQAAPAEPSPPQEHPETPVVPLVPPAPGDSPFPPREQTVTLTPVTEADFAEPAQSGSEAAPADPAKAAEHGDELFGDEPTEPVMRHEAESGPSRRFDWSVKGAYAVMGLTGLAACAFSAAAFRLAIADRSPFNDYTVIGWVLALIGLVCVSVAAWKLFLQGGRPD